MTGEKTTSPECPVCHSGQTSLALEAKDYTVSNQAFTIYECSQCTLRFTFPAPGPEDIGAYYKSENYISHTDTAKGMVNKLYHAVRKLSLRQKEKYVVRATGLSHGRILDIGSGTGAFLHTMKHAGWTVTGLEPDEQARQIAKQKHKIESLQAEDLFQLPPESFDAITLWHVLEHVHLLHEYLEQIKTLLAADGKLFIAVPNYTSWDAQHYGAYWAAYDVPRHLYHFSPAALRQLAESHQLYLDKMIVMPFDAFYISLLSEKYKTGQTSYLRGFSNGLRSWLHANKQPLHGSSIIYVLHK